MKALIVFAAVAILGAGAGLVRDLSPAQVEKLRNWKRGDAQNMWQLSGQFQGDIVLDENQRNGIIHERYRWPDNELPYELDPSMTEEQKQMIHDSVKVFGEVSCVKARPRRPEDGNYVYVTNEDTGCWSYVGRQSGKQILNLQGSRTNSGCFWTGTIAHEFLHAWGFYHQQSATERDDYVDIMWDNIEAGHEHNFDKYDADLITSFGEKYDYGSIMHYDAYAFSSNGQKTIVPKDPNAQIGQDDALSPIDIAKLKKMYAC